MDRLDQFLLEILEILEILEMDTSLELELSYIIHHTSLELSLELLLELLLESSPF